MNFITILSFAPACLWIPAPGDEVATDVNADADADADADTDTVDDNDTGADSGAPGGRAPSLTLFNVVQEGDYVEVTFATDDEDGDIEGGTLELAVGALTSSIPLPAGLDEWTGSAGTAIALFDPCMHGSTVEVSGVVKDARGLASEAKIDSVTLDGIALSVAEGGDVYNDAGTTVFTEVDETVWVCGDIYATNPVDTDWFLLQSYYVEGGVWTFTLTWSEASSDYDLQLDQNVCYSGASCYWTSDIAVADDHAGAQPEIMSATLQHLDGSNSIAYYLGVVGWGGGGGDYVLRIDPP